MRFPRSSGIVLHPTSLPGRFGVGDLGEAAYRFVDFLVAAGQGVWQVLPLGPTGCGDSPYQCLSAFAGNSLLISPDELLKAGLISPSHLSEVPGFPEDRADYEGAGEFKKRLLAEAYRSFKQSSDSLYREQFHRFCRANDGWLQDYALYQSVKDAHDGKHWTDWEEAVSQREAEAIEYWSERLSDELQLQKFCQFEFFRQWFELKKYCTRAGVRIMGDIPIFVAHDSAEVWAHRDYFHLDREGNRTVMAGVPPDYFSATGQLWGTPLYRWERMAEDGYHWWIERFRAAFFQADLIRVDHFRGFEACWEVPGSETTAMNGRWVKAPGDELLAAVEGTLGKLPVIAENLGLITPEVEALRKKFGFPGMGVLQFAFGADGQASDFIPYNHSRDMVIYTGTHDNDTTPGWWNSTAATDSTRSAEEIERERDLVRRYLVTDGREIHWDFIRAAMSSVANIAMFPLQDVLGLGSEARMNMPGRAEGNWRWRFRSGMITEQAKNRLHEMSRLYGRLPREKDDSSASRKAPNPQ